jgi:hypothetical protein
MPAAGEAAPVRRLEPGDCTVACRDRPGSEALPGVGGASRFRVHPALETFANPHPIATFRRIRRAVPLLPN